MNDAVSETIQSNEPPRFQFSLRRLMIFSICTGAGMVYSPLVTLFILIVFVLPAIVIKSWIESTVVSLTLFFVIGLLMPFTSPRQSNHRHKRHQLALEGISIALQRYHVDFQAYPPEAPRSTDSSESLAIFLCQPLQSNPTFGPYLEPSSDRLKDADGDGRPEFYNLRGQKYFYGVKGDGTSVVIDPGKDGLLGGYLSKQHGFISDSRDVNGDGTPDHEDNLYSAPPR